MTISEYITRSVSGYESISFWDSLRSTMPVYFFLAFFILYVGIMIALLSNIKGGKWVLLFCFIIAVVGWSWVKLYQRYELRTPVKRKVFAFRLAQGLGALNAAPEIDLNRKGTVAARLKTGRQDRDINLRYTQNLWLNLGGIMPGTPVQVPGKAHPRSWYLEIRGTTDLKATRPLEYDFSARKDDKDPGDGYGVHLYDAETHAELNPKTEDPDDLSQKIRQAIDGTILKGTLEINKGRFILRIFDNIEKIRRWRRPAIVYQAFQNNARPAGKGVPPEQAAFSGLSSILRLLTG